MHDLPGILTCVDTYTKSQKLQFVDTNFNLERSLQNMSSQDLSTTQETSIQIVQPELWLGTKPWWLSGTCVNQSLIYCSRLRV